MTMQEIYTALTGLNIPVAYYQFPDGLVTAPPFLCFYYGAKDYIYADDTNLVGKTPLTIELYTENRDFTSEAALETILTNNGLTFSQEVDIIDSEKMTRATYYTEVIF